MGILGHREGKYIVQATWLKVLILCACSTCSCPITPSSVGSRVFWIIEDFLWDGIQMVQRCFLVYCCCERIYKWAHACQDTSERQKRIYSPLKINIDLCVSPLLSFKFILKVDNPRLRDTRTVLYFLLK